MATFEELKSRENAEKTFNELKVDGSRLLKEGKIDAKTYYSKTRQAGIELGLIGENEYPGRLPGWVEPTLEVIGGTVGAIGGAILGIPGGPVGITAGAGAGAGVGSGGASLAVDFLGDLLAPDMPSPSARERLTDAALTGTIDAGLTVAAPVVGKSLSPLVRGALNRTKSQGTKIAGQIENKLPSRDESIGLAGKVLGITDDAAAKANLLGKEGVELSLGQASSSPFVQGAYTLSSRMPIAGGPGQSQLRQSFAQVDKALNRRISPTARIKPLTESERSKIIQEVGLKSFKDWRNSYKKVYDQADKISKAKGEYFDTSALAKLGDDLVPKSKFTEAPEDILDLLGDLRLYKSNFVTGRRGATQQMKTLSPKKLSFDDVRALDTKLKDLSKKYDPAKSATPNNYAYNTSIKISDTIKRQLRNPNDEAGRLYSSGDRLFKNYMEVVENQTGKEFQKAFGRGSIRPGVGRPPTERVENLYSKTFGQNKSPESVRELKNLVGKQEFNKITANYLDDVFTKYMRADRKDFDGLFKEFGFDNPKSLNYEATQELLKDYTFTSAKDLEGLLNALKQFPEVIPDVNTFVQRSGILRAAQGVTPGALAGIAGANMSGGPVGAAAGLGVMYALNRFLAKPFNKNLLKNAVPENPEGVKKFLRSFLDSLPQLPASVPPSAVAIQPAVPLVEQQLNE